MLTKQDKKFMETMNTEIVELKDIGKEIKRVRRRKGKSIKELGIKAFKTDVGCACLKLCEDGTARLNNVDTINKIFTALNCKIGFVVQDKGKGE